MVMLIGSLRGLSVLAGAIELLRGLGDDEAAGEPVVETLGRAFFGVEVAETAGF